MRLAIRWTTYSVSAIIVGIIISLIVATPIPKFFSGDIASIRYSRFIPNGKIWKNCLR